MKRLSKAKDDTNLMSPSQNFLTKMPVSRDDSARDSTGPKFGPLLS
jgi:hypothetical protein